MVRTTEHPEVVTYTPIHAFEPHLGIEQEIVDEINQRVAATNSIVELIDFVFERIPTCLPCDRIGVAFLQENGQRLVSHYSVANYQPLWLRKDFAQDLRGSSLEAVIRQGVPRIINDLAEYLAQQPDSVSTKLIVREGMRSSMTCPLMVDGRAIGVIFFSARTANAYQPRHVRLHLQIAERLAQAAEKALRIEELESANKAYMETLGFVAHELKNPVAAMITNAQLLTDGYLGEIAPEQREKLLNIIGKGQYLLGLVGDYLNLAQVESSEAGAKLVDIPDFVAAVVAPSIDLLREQIEAAGMVLERHFPDAPTAIRGDPALLRIAVANLLGNGIKYGNPGGRLRLSLIGGDRFEFSVWNEGPGFPPEKQSELFRRFSRLNTPELLSRKGTGIGLYTCWKILQMHGGKIWAESQAGAWARFSFRLPTGPAPAAPEVT